MTSAARPLSEVLQDIVRNIQEIVRSEVRLAKTELQRELVKAKSSGTLLGMGAATAAFAGLFLLLGIVYALALVLPLWAAFMAVAAVLAVGGALMLTAGIQRFKVIHPTPERTVETIKENVEWAKQQAK